jgi:plastocyanin
LDVSGNVTAGNIEVTASVGSISSTNLKIKDSLVELNFEGSTVSGTRDIGIFGRLDPTNGGNTNVVGLFYDGSDSTWKATYGATPANTNYVNSITSYKPIMAQNFIPAGVRADAGATITTTNTDDTIVLTHNAPTVTLHSAGNIEGQRITLIGDGGGGHTATINGAVVAITLANHDSVTVVRANGSWYVVSKFVA